MHTYITYSYLAKRHALKTMGYGILYNNIMMRINGKAKIEKGGKKLKEKQARMKA